MNTGQREKKKKKKKNLSKGQKVGGNFITLIAKFDFDVDIIFRFLVKKKKDIRNKIFHGLNFLEVLILSRSSDFFIFFFTFLKF